MGFLRFTAGSTPKYLTDVLNTLAFNQTRLQIIMKRPPLHSGLLFIPFSNPPVFPFSTLSFTFTVPTTSSRSTDLENRGSHPSLQPSEIICSSLPVLGLPALAGPV